MAIRRQVLKGALGLSLAAALGSAAFAQDAAKVLDFADDGAVRLDG